LGLGINSVAPVIAQRYGANALNSGIAINIVAIGGTIIPVVFSQNVKNVVFLTVLSMLALLIMERRNAREKIAF